MDSTPLPRLAAPANRALEAQGISTVQGLSGITRAELTDLHGIGTRALVLLDLALDEAQVRLADEQDHELIFIEERVQGGATPDGPTLAWTPVMALRTGSD